MGVGMQAPVLLGGWRDAGLELGVHRLIPQLLVLDEHGSGVNGEAVNAAGKPEVQDVRHGATHRRIAPVQVGLLSKESVIVILPSGSIELPGAAAESAQPVVGRSTGRARIPPDIPVALGMRTGAAAFPEPWMRIRGMVWHEVED